MWALPPTDGAGAAANNDNEARPDADADGGNGGRSKRRRALDGLVEAVRQPGTVMIAAGASILTSVAGIDDVAEALDHMSYVNADRAVGAGATLIVSGVASLSHMMLSGRRFGELEKAVQGNTDAINEVKVAVQGNTDAINEVKVAVQGNTDAINDMRNDMRNDMKILTAATTRVAEAVEGMTSALEGMSSKVEGLVSSVDGLVDEIRRGNGGRSGGA